MLPQALEIIFEMPKKKKKNLKITRKKKVFQLAKHVCLFVFFSSLNISYLQTS
jgi:hypothetical protein